MTSFVNRTVAAMLVALGAAGSMGCELIASADRSKISDGVGGQGGTGGQGGAGGSEAACGDGAIAEGEACDDGNADAGDGCDASCAVETGYTCSGEPSTCGTSCGDGIVAGQEACDDMNNTAGDGCDPSCAVESGYDCTGSPSVCTTTCGDGTVAGTEACDDGNTADCDGCRADCSAAETGCGDSFTCGAEACDDGNTADGDGCDSNCTATACGNGVTTAGEACDDGNTTDGDSCDSNCTPTGCGNGIVTAGEVCDDGNTTSGDNCDANCTPTGCGNGVVTAGEVCDDGNTTSGDNCDANCTPTGCGNGVVTAGEVCDDGNTVSGDGCDANCTPTACGNGVMTAGEACDDGNTADCDGCRANCGAVETGCGDTFVCGAEQCDDGNQTNLDGCNNACAVDTFTESEVNNTAAQADGPYTPEVLISGAVTPLADVDFFAITVPATADLYIATYDASGPTSCANGMNSVVTLYGTDGTTSLVSRSTGNGTPCGAIDSTKPGDAAARHLPAGTYYVSVNDYLNNNTIAGYTLVVQFNALCGDGVVEGAEECDGGAGCSATCDRVQVCGDGFVDAPETCDDGNTAPGDGCSATCQLELFMETEFNGSSASANGPVTPFALIQGSLNPIGDVDYFAFTLTATSDVRIESFDGDGPGSCVNIDTYLFLLDTDGNTVLTSADDGGIANCSRIDPAIDPNARHLPPGTYYVDVEDFGNNTLIPAYRLTIELTAVCGDGVVEGGEECDGGAGCDASCDRVQTCGDGYVDAPETCDDGNTSAGDGCDAACLLETTAEVEPNNVTVQADAAPVQLTGSAVVTGGIGFVGDLDVFRLTLAQASVVRFETFETNVSGCGGIATTLRIYDAGGAQIYADDGGGIASCSALVLSLPAGTYYAQVEERGNNATIAAYNLQVSVVASGGSESEVNDTQAAADPVSGAEVYVVGGHLANDDSDYFAIDVPSGKSLRAELIEGGAETCESNGVDSYLTLFDASGVELGSDDDAGRGFCSMIDGTGTPAENGYAGGLSGTYYLQVTAAPFASGAGDPNGQFDYRLVITIR